MWTKRFVAALACLALVLTLTGCRNKCCKSASFAPPPSGCCPAPAPGGAAFLPPPGP